MDLVRKSVEQMRAEALKRTTEKKEEENRKNMFLEQETRRQNQANAFAMHIQKVKNNEDVIAKSVLNVKQAEDEYETMLSANGISNSNNDLVKELLIPNIVNITSIASTAFSLALVLTTSSIISKVTNIKPYLTLINNHCIASLSSTYSFITLSYILVNILSSSVGKCSLI